MKNKLKKKLFEAVIVVQSNAVIVVQSNAIYSKSLPHIYLDTHHHPTAWQLILFLKCGLLPFSLQLLYGPSLLYPPTHTPIHLDLIINPFLWVGYTINCVLHHILYKCLHMRSFHKIISYLVSYT